MPGQDMRIANGGREIALERHASSYPTMMKRSTRKLVMRREIVRMLAELDLVGVVGGAPKVQLMDTGGSPANTCVQAMLTAKP